MSLGLRLPYERPLDLLLPFSTCFSRIGVSVCKKVSQEDYFLFLRHTLCATLLFEISGGIYDGVDPFFLLRVRQILTLDGLPGRCKCVEASAGQLIAR